MKLKGVNYDVGRVLQGRNMRPNFNEKTVHRELEIIKNDLHCNSVKIQGFDIDNIMIAAENALKQDLDVWLAPEMFEKSPEETLEYTLKAAVEAEKLRSRWPKQVAFSLGTELTLFMQGILEGNNLMERIGSLYSLRGKLNAGKHNKLLNAYLAKANTGVRRLFHGNVTYASVARIETVDWNIFDFVCIDIYRDKMIRHSYGDAVRSYLVHDKPVVIGEFGCCTFRGAEDLGAMGWDILDWGKSPPQLKRDYVYDQGVQARELSEQLGVLDGAGVYGAYVFTFVQPAPDSGDPEVKKMIENLKFDPDITSYSLVKSFAGKHGTTYPDMMWEPKESFRAVADYYAGH